MSNNMKTVFIILVGIFISINLFAQNDKKDTKREVWFEPAPTGFEFVPQGSYQDTIITKTDTVVKTISVAPFWMSNEITNKEFREFTNYLTNNPNDSLCIIDWNKAKKDNKESFDNGKFDKAKYTRCVKNKEISKIIIDTLLIKNDKPEFKNYFINKKYDDYPVVGVSFRGATFYCIWKTRTEKEKNGPQYKMNDYRLPVAEEWKYAASMAQAEKKNNSKELQKVNSGTKNELKLFNLSGNVSEWTSTAPDSLLPDKKVVMGGSWKTRPNLYEKNTAEKKFQSSSIGFRLARSYRGGASDK